MSQPPGYEKIAFLYLPTILPANITEDLISLINPSGISKLFTFEESITTLFLLHFTLQPSLFNISIIICVSCIFGTLYNFDTPLLSIVAAIIGSDAFFEPDT